MITEEQYLSVRLAHERLLSLYEDIEPDQTDDPFTPEQIAAIKLYVQENPNWREEA